MFLKNYSHNLLLYIKKNRCGCSW